MRYEVTVRGKCHLWSIPVTAAQAKAMSDDGFEVIEVHNSMPSWVFECGLATVWCFAQDIYDIPSNILRKIKGGDQ